MVHDVSELAAVWDVTRVTSVGEKINAHILPAVVEPQPDFEAMLRLISGLKNEGEAPEKNDDPKG